MPAAEILSLSSRLSRMLDNDYDYDKNRLGISVPLH
jgi:hypothetical protein